MPRGSNHFRLFVCGGISACVCVCVCMCVGVGVGGGMPLHSAGSDSDENRLIKEVSKKVVVSVTPVATSASEGRSHGNTGSRTRASRTLRSMRNTHVTSRHATI